MKYPLIGFAEGARAAPDLLGTLCCQRERRQDPRLPAVDLRCEARDGACGGRVAGDWSSLGRSAFRPFTEQIRSRGRQRSRSLLLLVLLAIAAAPALAEVRVIPTDGRPLVRLVAAELTGGPREQEFVGACPDGRISAWTYDGARLWEYEAGAFVFDLAAGDLDGNDGDEIVAGLADGTVVVLSVHGQVLSRSDVGVPVWQVCVARLDERGPSVVVGGASGLLVRFDATGTRRYSTHLDGGIRLLRAGRFGRGLLQSVAVGTKERVFIEGRRANPDASIDDPDGGMIRETAWRLALRSGGQLQITESSLSLVASRSDGALSGIAADLDGDGVDLLATSHGCWSWRGGMARTIRLPDPPPTARRVPIGMRMVAPGDFAGARGIEIAIVDGGEVQVIDEDGKALGRARAPFGFSDAIALKGLRGTALLLGCSPGGDDSVTRVDFSPGWEQEFERLSVRGRLAEIAESIGQLRLLALSREPIPMQPSEPVFPVCVRGFALDRPAALEDLPAWVRERGEWAKRYPSGRLRFCILVWAVEKGEWTDGDDKRWPRQAALGAGLDANGLVMAAERLESAGCPFWLGVGFGSVPTLQPETAQRILAAAPKTCLGFLSCDDEVGGSYLLDHVAPLLRICEQSGRRFVLQEGSGWWARTPAALFPDDRSVALVPCAHDAGSRLSDLDLAARVGLWLDGRVHEWAARVSEHTFAALEEWNWGAPETGHPHLRELFAHTLLGASCFFLSGAEREGGEWTRMGLESADPFLHLLGSGRLSPPAPDEVRVSRVALRFDEPAGEFLRPSDLRLARVGARDPPPPPAAFARLSAAWALAPTAAEDVAGPFWGRTRQYVNPLPSGAAGFVCVLPGGMEPNPTRWNRVWSTDGVRLRRDDQDVEPAQAAEALRVALDQAAQEDPFRIEGTAFRSVRSDGQGRFRIGLIDPGWIDPDQRELRLVARKGQRLRVTDELTGGSLGDPARLVRVILPPAGIRLLEVRIEDE